MTRARLAPTLLLLAACAVGEEWRITDSNTTLGQGTEGDDDETGPQISASATVGASTSTASTSAATDDTAPSTTEPVEGTSGSTSIEGSSSGDGSGSSSGSGSGDVESSTTEAPSTIDLSGWTIEQTDSARTFEIPAGTHVPTGGVLVIGRDVDQAGFEAYWGVTFGGDVVYLSGGNDFPTINGDETYTLRDDTMAVVDGPSPPLAIGETLERIDPESDGPSAWTNATADVGTASPGESVDPPEGYVGAYLSEMSDANGNGNFVYEFVEVRVF